MIRRAKINQGGVPVEYSPVPLTGFRSWIIMPEANGFGLALQSIHVTYQWQPGMQEATCHGSGANRKPHAGPSPDLACACGFYCQLADHPIGEWDDLIKSVVHATGMVAMSGRIIQCTAGYKASHVQIISPVLIEMPCVDPTCDEETIGLAIPVPGAYRYRAACRAHLPALGDAPVLNAELWATEACRALSERYQVEVFSWKNV